MFLKPTISKISISTIFSFVLGYFLHRIFFPCEPVNVILEDGTAPYGDPECAFVYFTSLPSFWILVFGLMVAIYIVLSFIRKK